MDDPGTIYSDDEVENYSESDSEEERLMNDTTNSSSFIQKYLGNKSGFDVNCTIQKVVEEEKSRGNEALEIVSSLGLKDDVQKEFKCSQKENERLKKSEKHQTKKLKRKERTEKLIAEGLDKDKEEFGFEDAPLAPPNMSFDDINLSIQLLRAIAHMGYNKPTPIQAATIPIALRGRDIFGCAATGTGKTAAFILPIIQRLIFKPQTNEDITRVLIMVPTRELGVQVFEVAQDAAKFTEISISLSVGGLDRNTQCKELLKCPDIVIATPGRLIDHMHNTSGFSLNDVEILVLDEADRMLDDFFVEQLTEIVRQCSSHRQTMLFSATMSDQVKDLVVVSLKKPVRVFVNYNTDVAQNLCQEFIRLKKQFQNDNSRLAVLAYLITNNCNEETIVFMRHKSDCHKLRILFSLLGLKCGELHGDLKQTQRLTNLEKFKKKEIKILFATDVAARGLDIKGVKKVINFTVPTSYEMYVHRVGRTARAGKSGNSITISNDSGKDFSLLRRIQRDSLSSLYERIIDPKHIVSFVEKIKELDRLVQKVLKREKEDKMHGGPLGGSAKSKKKNKLLKDIDPKDKKAVLEEIREERKRLQKRLKMLNQGIIPEAQKVKKKDLPKKSSKPSNENIHKFNVKKNPKEMPFQRHQGKGKKTPKRMAEETQNEDGKKSLFDKDISYKNKFGRKDGKFQQNRRR